MRGAGSVTAATLGVLDGRRAWTEGNPPNPIHSVEFVVRAAGGRAPTENMREMARRSIKKANRLGVDVVVADTKVQIDQFAILAADCTSGCAARRR